MFRVRWDGRVFFITVYGWLEVEESFNLSMVKPYLTTSLV